MRLSLAPLPAGPESPSEQAPARVTRRRRLCCVASSTLWRSTKVGARHDVDPRRRYLTGFSYGGNGVFDLGLAQPDLWAALWSVDPTRVPPRAMPRPLWLSVGECARPLRRELDQVLALRDAGDVADGDRLALDRGEDHVATVATAYSNPRIRAWLLARRRDD